MPVELWASLSPLGFSKYEISTEGRIMNIDRGYILKGSSFQGYIRVGLVDDNGDSKSRLIHRLAGEIFLSKEGFPKTASIDHIDRNRSNNRITNLRWATSSQQNSNKAAANHQGRPVIQMDKNGVVLKKWDKIVDAARSLNTAKSNISARCNTNLTVCGFLWKYDNEDLDGEVWKEIPYKNYEPLFVSSEGRVRRANGRTSYGSMTRSGYYSVTICKIPSRHRKAKRVHVLIMAAFLGVKDGFFVNHIDGNKANNKLTNLEYVTHIENVHHAIKTGLREYSGGHISRTLDQYTLDGQLVATFNSPTEANIKTNISKGNISSVCQGKRFQAGGFIWKYRDD